MPLGLKDLYKRAQIWTDKMGISPALASVLSFPF